jgi:hypothetical protein
METFEVTDARMAENQARFRDANEQLEQAAENLRMDTGVPFLCECPDMNCTTIIPLSLSEYEAIRSSPLRFFAAVDHEIVRDGFSRVIEQTERYVIAEKQGLAAETVEELDRRTT